MSTIQRKRKTENQPSVPTPPEPDPKTAVSDTQRGSLPDFIKEEYTHLINLYTHTENSLNSIFNFYVTLLTTITGAIVILYQIRGSTQDSLFLTVGFLLGFIVLLGVLIQNALLHKNSDLSHFTLAINALKSFALKDQPQFQQHVFYMESIYTQVHPMIHKPDPSERLSRYLWWALPMGIQQLFVSIVNSLSLTGIAALFLLGILPDLVPISELPVRCSLVFFLSFVVQSMYASMAFRHYFIRSSVNMAGRQYEFAEQRGKKKI